MSDALVAELRNQNRILKMLLAFGGLAFTMILLMAAKSPTKRVQFSEIDVERVNIINPDGKPAMVLANCKRLPDPIQNGKTTSSIRGEMPGLIFYNSVGDECGGLIFDGKLGDASKPRSGMHFSMDRFGGDQQIALVHYENAGFMETGLKVFDRGLGKEDVGQIDRLFVGRTPGLSSAVILSDAKGAPRIMMYVTPEGKSVLDFMDDKGRVIQSLGQPQTSK
jgi:hypothetical protein